MRGVAAHAARTHRTTKAESPIFHAWYKYPTSFYDFASCFLPHPIFLIVCVCIDGPSLFVYPYEFSLRCASLPIQYLCSSPSQPKSLAHLHHSLVFVVFAYPQMDARLRTTSSLIPLNPFSTPHPSALVPGSTASTRPTQV